MLTYYFSYLADIDAILIYANPPGAPAVPLVAAWDLDSFGWLQRGTVQDVMAFMSKVSERVDYRAYYLCGFRVNA